jgi:hypothetical protein
VRAAQFLVSNAGPGYDGLGGSADRNIARWYSQFKESSEALGATIETRDKAGHRLHYFRATGTLIGRDREMPDYALHAALLGGRAGRVFVRFVAPKAIERTNEAAFRKLIETAFGD